MSKRKSLDGAAGGGSASKAKKTGGNWHEDDAPLTNGSGGASSGEKSKAEYLQQERDKARAFMSAMQPGGAAPKTPGSKEKSKVAKAARASLNLSSAAVLNNLAKVGAAPSAGNSPMAVPSPASASTKKQPRAKPQASAPRAQTPPLPPSPLSPDARVGMTAAEREREDKRRRMETIRAQARGEFLQQQQAALATPRSSSAIKGPLQVAVARPVGPTSASKKRAPLALARSDSVRSDQCAAAVVSGRKGGRGQWVSWVRPRTLQFAVQLLGLGALVWLMQSGALDISHLQTFTGAYRFFAPVAVGATICLVLGGFGLLCRQMLSLATEDSPQKSMESLQLAVTGLGTVVTLIHVLRETFLPTREKA